MSKPDYGTATDYSKPPERKSPPLPAEAYLGGYDNAFFGAIEIAEKEGTPVLRLGPKQRAFPLRHWNRDVILCQPSGEMAGGPSGLTFSVSSDRKAAQVVIENLDVHGQGTFTRAKK